MNNMVKQSELLQLPYFDAQLYGRRGRGNKDQVLYLNLLKLVHNNLQNEEVSFGKRDVKFK